LFRRVGLKVSRSGKP